MRFIINDDDSYIWTTLSRKKYLFSKFISEHSIEAYKKLCEEIEITFETLSIIVEQNSTNCL